jgi:trimeric autotransporter adhesin
MKYTRKIKRNISTSTNSISNCPCAKESSSSTNDITIQQACNAVASGVCSHAEGSNTIASLFASHAEGDSTMASERAAHSEGVSTRAINIASHAEGSGSVSEGFASHAEGFFTRSTGEHSHSEGDNTIARGLGAHAEGVRTTTAGQGAHAEGTGCVAENVQAHAEGLNTRASGPNAHSEGNNTLASGENSHSEGQNALASGLNAHAEGFQVTASGINAHAEGRLTTASGFNSHAEGNGTRASGINSHAEGFQTQATGNNAHAEGRITVASGFNSHAEGQGTRTGTLEGAHIMGRFGDATNTYSWHLANGISSTNRSLAAKIRNDGLGIADRGWVAGNADFAEMFETLDGKPIEPGYFVTLEGDKIRKAKAGDTFILGITSSNPAFLADAGDLRWKEKYLTDESGNIKYHEEKVKAVKDNKGNVITPEYTEMQPMLNPKWDNNKKYVSRLERAEWVPVAAIGKLIVRDDGTCKVNGYCMPNDYGIATSSNWGYRVMKRISKNQILVWII